jgi:hypothetical protein
MRVGITKPHVRGQKSEGTVDMTAPPESPSVGVRGKPTVPPNRANRPRTSPGAVRRRSNPRAHGRIADPGGFGNHLERHTSRSGAYYSHGASGL